MGIFLFLQKIPPAQNKLEFVALAHEFIIKNYKLQMKVFPSEIILNDGQSPYLSL